MISALLSSLSTLPTLRPADPGEFTRQALLGGRLDLTQVEGLHDLIEADTEVQRVWALDSAAVNSFLFHIRVFSNLNSSAIRRETLAQSMILYALKSSTV